MSESKGRQTSTTGEVYTHPRSKDYGTEFDRIFNNDPDTSGDDPLCVKECEECRCQIGERSSNA